MVRRGSASAPDAAPPTSRSSCALLPPWFVRGVLEQGQERPVQQRMIGRPEGPAAEQEGLPVHGFDRGDRQLLVRDSRYLADQGALVIEHDLGAWCARPQGTEDVRPDPVCLSLGFGAKTFMPCFAAVD